MRVFRHHLVAFDGILAFAELAGIFDVEPFQDLEVDALATCSRTSPKRRFISLRLAQCFKTPSVPAAVEADTWGFCGTGAASHLASVAAISAPGFRMTLPLRSGQRDLVITSVLSRSRSPQTSNSYSTPSRITGASPTLRGTVLPVRSSFSSTHSVFTRMLTRMWMGAASMASIIRLCIGETWRQAAKELLLERAVMASTWSSSPPSPIQKCDQESVIRVAYPCAATSPIRRGKMAGL